MYQEKSINCFIENKSMKVKATQEGPLSHFIPQKDEVGKGTQWLAASLIKKNSIILIVIKGSSIGKNLLRSVCNQSLGQKIRFIAEQVLSNIIKSSVQNSLMQATNILQLYKQIAQILQGQKQIWAILCGGHQI